MRGEKSPVIQCVLFGLRWHALDGCDLHGGLDPRLALIFDLVPISCACHRLQGAFHALMEQLKGRGDLKMTVTIHKHHKRTHSGLHAKCYIARTKQRKKKLTRIYYTAALLPCWAQMVKNIKIYLSVHIVTDVYTLINSCCLWFLVTKSNNIMSAVVLNEQLVISTSTVREKASSKIMRFISSDSRMLHF